MFALLKAYANVEFVRFPVDIDGLCLDLKAIGKRPTVLVNSGKSRVRQRFTMAHELGHVLIPWHRGSIVDEIDASGTFDSEYFATEAEANRFASELLMPSCWVTEELSGSENPVLALSNLVEQADVSLQAALIRVANLLPPNYVVAHLSDRRVTWSAKTEGTLAAAVKPGTDLSVMNPYPFPCRSWSKAFAKSECIIWHFHDVDQLSDSQGQRPWREILGEIVLGIVDNVDEARKLKSSINGVMSAANGRIGTARCFGSVHTAVLQRLHSVAATDIRFKKLVEHTLFDAFCRARVCDYLGMS